MAAPSWDLLNQMILGAGMKWVRLSQVIKCLKTRLSQVQVLSPAGRRLPMVCEEGAVGRTSLRPGTVTTQEEKGGDPFLIPMGSFAHP